MKYIKNILSKLHLFFVGCKFKTSRQKIEIFGNKSQYRPIILTKDNKIVETFSSCKEYDFYMTIYDLYLQDNKPDNGYRVDYLHYRYKSTSWTPKELEEYHELLKDENYITEFKRRHNPPIS